MIKIAICDDNSNICAQLEDILLSYAASTYLKVDIDVFFTGEKLLDYIKCGNTFDLIYLDIELGQVNGIEVGKQLRKVLKDYSTEIVYISGHDGYDRQLFDVQPLHFIPKPISKAVVIDDLNLAMERSKKRTAFFQYQNRFDTYKIPVDEIIYFESLNRKIKIVTTQDEHFFYGSLESIMLRLAGEQFLQIHRSYVINYNHITVLRYTEVTMSNGITLPISRTKQQEFRNIQLNEI